MLGFSLTKIVEVMVVVLVPMAMVFFGDRNAPLPSRLALGLGMVGGVFFLLSVFSSSGVEEEYLVAATVGLGLGGWSRSTSP